MRRGVAAALLTALVFALAACGGDDEGTEGQGETTPTVAEQPPTTDATTAGETETEDETETEGEAGDVEDGAEVFASAGCGNCHTFSPAGSTGTTGPNLDESDVDFDAAVDQITEGGGGMPAFGDQLSDEDIRNVAAFVVARGELGS